ncbi:MAG: TolC family protein [bacterium]|nr:TolC family protein [bacterium]
MRLSLVMIPFVAAIGGCASPAIKSEATAPDMQTITETGKQYSEDQSSQPGTADLPESEPTGDLTFRQAEALAVLYNPSLAAYKWEIRVREALTIQAGLPPNPELEMELENFAGTGGVGAFNQAESTLLYNQMIETGGKRENRRTVAQLEAEGAKQEFLAARSNVWAETAKRFFSALASQELIEIHHELVKLAEEAFYAVSERVKTGRAAPLEETRARVELAAERNLLEQAKRDLQAEKAWLAAAWGSESVSFDSVEGDLERISESLDLDELRSALENNPEIQRWKVELRQREAELTLERSRSISDVTVRGGMRYLNEPEDVAAVAAISVPLTLFDRNQGAIRAARERVNKTREQTRAAFVEINASLARLYHLLSSSRIQIDRLKNEILPGARSAYEAVREGYQQGKFDYLNVLDAQRTLFNSRIEYVRTLAEFHSNWTELQRLIGEPSPETIQNTPQITNEGN